MAEDRTERRLAAILAADVVGYSRLMGKDEEGTLRALNAHLKELIEPLIVKHNGRMVKTTGDGLLVEFSSVIDAVHCSVAFQKGMRDRTADIPDDRKIAFRIGINIGDVIIQDNDVFGDGVNVAARLEGLAHPGGICISRAARDQIRDKLDYGLEDMGAVEVKNIARPVRAFRVLYDGETPRSSASSRHLTLPVTALAVLLVAGASLWWWQPWVTQNKKQMQIGSSQRDGPTIVVLPFTNISGNKNQDYFSAGITEDINTDLSKVSGLFVAPNSSSRRYRGKEIDPRAIATQLGVRYVLEGSVRRAHGKIRITARLIDGLSGTQMWADRFDRNLKDVFAVQDEISQKVVARLSGTLKSGALERTTRRYTPKIEAYDLYIQGRAKRIPPTPNNLSAALKMFEKAIEIDPNFAGGYSGAAYVHILKYGNPAPPGASPPDDIKAARRLAEKAVKLDPTFGPAWGSLSEAYVRIGKYDDALQAINKAMEAAQNDSLMRATYGRLLGHIGRAEEGIIQVKSAMRMSPDSLPMLYFLGANYRAAGQFENAIEALIEHRKRLGGRIIPPPTTQLIVAYVQAGLIEKARAEVQALLRVSPRFTSSVAARTHSYKFEEDRVQFLKALKQAGLPE